MARAGQEGRRAAATRRRGAVLEDAILQAAAEVLTESGVAGLTMEEVARRAGTNKNALYRRWPNRLVLGVAAYRRLAAAETAPPDTGSLRGDALEMLRRANSTWSSPYGEILRGLIAAADGTEELLAELRRDPRAGGDACEAAWLTLLGRAVARGEAAPEALHPRVASAPTALLRNEYVTRGVPAVPDAVLTEIVDEVFLPLVRGRGPAGGASAG
ncbi:TetR/AcrR family transcriptional regulator [Streptomyces lomondensis]|uniref:TetR family transcriptional regulator n=1 Tax=Streptomyces lomondensis TaxID=68229 RepID=A0ABQ2XAA6_9ACTN|nr:TetR/AcrR family transcriptional regulator [Streptomyces lomondensis]MCF0077089.1 TetR/AcrR family transcriptional regulator [Streptomyces lomondensis]GGX06810.1 TetR family transcriptional regulator [Streptomyces lomondensis]